MFIRDYIIAIAIGMYAMWFLIELGKEDEHEDSD